MADIEVSCDLQNKKNINASFSDVLDINLQKEIKMGIELNAPLYIGADTNLQQQVTQNTTDIADLKQDVSDIETDIGSLDNLTTTDKSSLVGAINEVNTLLPPTSQRDYIDNSKAMPTGEVSSNALILPEIQNYAHSTFDLSKFTVVGSPNITDDGIASGFSNNNYLKMPYVDLTKNFEMSIVFVAKISSTSQGIIMTDYDNFSQRQIGIWEYGNKLNYYFSTDGTGWDVSFMGNTTLIDSNTYKLSLIKNGTLTKAILKNLDTNNTIEEFNDNSGISLFNSSKGLRLGSSGSGFWNYFEGSFDLKHFSITVDGVEVFSGNKTGIDTIKPDDYTEVGTPTISADGIASGFSTSNYLRIPIGLPVSGKPFTIQMVANANCFVNNSFLFCTNTSLVVSPKLWLYCNNSDNPIFIANVGNGDRTIGGVGQTLSTDTNYLFEFGQRADYQFFLKVTNLDTGTIVGTEKVTTGETAFYSGNFANAYLSKADNFYWTGSIDLNAFKIYVDGDLVYQPCLKMPYTASKSGSKIVDSIYRDRVTDMYEQFGYANYYTLSDTDFTLPQVELYGLIGQRTLRDSYRNGINYWELYSNRDLEQGGSCTSGVEVTFARPFADTNYVLSVPYSAKSATAFTPTQTGDWIAKGKGVL